MVITFEKVEELLRRMNEARERFEAASKALDPEGQHDNWREQEARQAAGYENVRDVPLGCGLGVVELVDIISTTQALGRGLIGDRERAFGNYGPGRYAWKLDRPRRFAEPVPARGYQMLWNWPWEEVANTRPADYNSARL